MPEKKSKKASFSEEDATSLTQRSLIYLYLMYCSLSYVLSFYFGLCRYDATTVLTLLQEIAHYPHAKIDWNELVKKTSTGISSAREYQMLWRHLAYRDALSDNFEDGAQPLVYCFLC